MTRKIKILIAEHDQHDLEMIANELKNAGIDFVSEIVENETSFRQALNDFVPEVCGAGVLMAGVCSAFCLA